MKLNWYTLCYNEEIIIPYVIDYWKKIINDGINLKVIVYDNHSTDNSVELLSKYILILFNDCAIGDVIGHCHNGKFAIAGGRKYHTLGKNATEFDGF